MTTTLVFRNTVLETVFLEGQIWFTFAELAKALGYADPKAVSGLYNSNKDEFTASMSKVVDSTTLGKSRNTIRIFSLRGAHLISMLARTPVAKEFRIWVLDILDKETSIPQYKPQAAELFSNDDVDCLARLVWRMANGFNFARAWRSAMTGIFRDNAEFGRLMTRLGYVSIRTRKITGRFENFWVYRIRGKGLLDDGLCADNQLSKKSFIPFVQVSKNERFGFKHAAIDGKWLYVYADHIRFLTPKRHRVNGVRVQGYTANGVRVDMVA